MTDLEERFVSAALLADFPDAIINDMTARLNDPTELSEDMRDAIRVPDPRGWANWLQRVPALFPALDSTLSALAQHDPSYQPAYDAAKAAYDAL
ncbi:hypothetical protein [uncultured Brevundimonas sp.]|uniref:hypothetical protein n=1 Tax=uncultured Brevundimonas sp. TaxID=213418 RepID=UPI0025D30340|nr:hypothetical protein [uncultured Brevundimonas sp.]